MIFDLVQSPTSGGIYARTPDKFYAAENADTEPFELCQMLRDAFPERAREFCVVCYDGYENAVSL